MLSTKIQKIVYTKFARLMKPLDVKKKSWSIYQDLRELTLDRFIDAYCFGELSKLVKSGNPPIEELEASWAETLKKYTEIIGGEDFHSKMNMITKVNDLVFKVHRVEALMEVLNIAPTEGLFRQLYEFGYVLPSLEYNEPNIARLCKIVTSAMKRDVAEIQVLSKSLDEGKADTKATPETFYNILVEISEAFKVVLTEDINVMAFAMYIKKYKDKVEHLQNQNIKNV